jgi:hypothetical protein
LKVLIAEEYGKMKEDIPPMLERAHAKNITANAKDNEGGINCEIGLSAFDTKVRIFIRITLLVVIFFNRRAKMIKMRVRNQF